MKFFCYAILNKKRLQNGKLLGRDAPPHIALLRLRERNVGGNQESEREKSQKTYVVTDIYIVSMSELSASKAEAIHDEVVKKAGETIFRKYKVILNITGKNVASIDDVYPDLLAYDVYSVKPFIASSTPTLISEVEVEAEITDELVAKWLELKSLDVDRIVLILPEKTRNGAEEVVKKLGPKFELRFFDKDLRIS